MADFNLTEFVESLVKTIPDVKAVIQFGSSLSCDYIEGISDIDLAVIVGSKSSENAANKFMLKHAPYHLQMHVIPLRLFIKNLKAANPLDLSILYTGKTLYGSDLFNRLKNRKFKPNNSTRRKCMLNSFAALSIAISDLTHSMAYDSVNGMYHSARTAIWALLFSKQITPRNKEIFELLENKKIVNWYRKIIEFRENIPDFENDLSLDKKIYEKGNINEFTQTLQYAMNIIKICYKQIFKRNFVDFFELLNKIKKKYGVPNFYFIMLSVNWEKMRPFYMVTLHFEDKETVFIIADASTGMFKTISMHDTKIAE